MEDSMFTSFNNDMEMDDLGFIDHLQQFDSSLEDMIFGSSYLPNISENNNIDEQALIRCKIYAQQVDHHHHHAIIEEKPFKQLETTNNNNWNNSSNNKITNNNNNNHALISQDHQDAFTSIMLSFDNSNNLNNCSQNHQILNDPPQVGKRTSSALATLPQQSKDHHILAERKRREKLNQRFIALSTIIPGLKKMDKATVLGDAYKYVKQLEEQVKTLEKVTKTKKIESAVLVNRSMISEDDDQSCSSIVDGHQIPEIEVKFSNQDVLIRIHCQKKNNRVIEKLISQIEDLHLLVNNSSALVFGSASLDATIIAQMGEEFSMTAKDLVRHLHVALKHLM